MKLSDLQSQNPYPILLLLLLLLNSLLTNKTLYVYRRHI